MGKKNLNAKEKLFCLYYEKTRNGRESAAHAGYEIMPQRAAIKLLNREDIRKEVKKLGKPATLDEVCSGYRRLAFGSVADALRLIYTEEIPNIEEFEKLDLFNVSDIKRPKGGGIEIKFFDRLKALEHLEEINEIADTAGAVPFYDALERSARALSEQNE